MKFSICRIHHAMRPLPQLLPVFLLVLPCVQAFPETGEPERALVEKLVRDQLTSWETEDEELFLSTAHPELVFAYPGKRMGVDGAMEVFRFWKENFSDTRIHIHALIIEGNRFSVEYQYATTKDETGIRTASGTVSTGHVEDGKLRVWKEYLDGRVSRLQAKGELPVDEFAEPFPWPDGDAPANASSDENG